MNCITSWLLQSKRFSQKTFKNWTSMNILLRSRASFIAGRLKIIKHTNLPLVLSG